MSAHTPGPWIDKGCRRTMAGGRRSIEVGPGGGRRTVALVEKPADALLVMAAPELLTMLERVLEVSVEPCTCDEDGEHPRCDFHATEDDARALIAKARGT